MKRIIMMMLAAILSLSVFAQKDVTKFLGIPVDGTVQKMKHKLLKKGFKDDCYNKNQVSGWFNGDQVVVTMAGDNNNKLWRVSVGITVQCSGADIKIRFNNLCQQFYRNKKYIARTSEENCLIPEDEDVDYNISINHKRYDAVFYQVSIDNPSIDTNKVVWFKINEMDGKYYIMIFYDNGYNMANGEDL